MAKLLSGKTLAVRVQNFNMQENFHGSMLVDLRTLPTDKATIRGKTFAIE